MSDSTERAAVVAWLRRGAHYAPLHTGSATRAMFEKLASLIERGDGECWHWQASLTTGGYGRFKIASYRQVQAHRVALIATRWADPGGMLVMHRCDTPSCCNPKHLRFGTIADNNNDKARKGRGKTGDQRGFNNGAAKITPAALAFIVEKMREGWNNCQIAAEVGVTHQAISKIRTGKHWTAQVSEIREQAA